MIPPTILPNDASELHRDKVRRALRNRARLDAIERTGLLESALEIPPLTRAVRLAAKALRAPIAQVNVLTDKLFVPIAAYSEGNAETALWSMRRHVGNSYCKYVVWTRQPFQVDDAREHALVRHSHATRELGISAYLAVPIHAPASGTSERPIVGTLCVVDHAPREWSADDLLTLTDMSTGISDLIAARMRVHAQVKAVEQQAERVLDAVGVAVLATDARGVTTFANPEAARLLGFTIEEMTGRDQHALIHHTRPDGRRYPESECPNYRARKEGRSFHASNDTYWRSDGEPILVDSTMTPIFERGEVIGTVLTFSDIGARHAVAASERTARLGAEAANRAKTELLAAMSHELRIPLVAIGDHAQRLEASLVDIATSEQRDDLRSIQRSLQHLLGLIDNVVQFSTLEVPGRT